MREKTGVPNIKNDRGNITIDATHVKKIKWGFINNFVNKNTYRTFELTENLNSPVSFNEIKSIIYNIPTTKTPDPDGYPGKCYQTFRGKY